MKRICALLVAVLSMTATPTWAVDDVTLALNWNVPYSGWAGFYVARDRGYYKSEGLNVEFLLVKGSNPANQAVAAGDAQLGVSTASSVMVAANRGLPLLTVSAYMQSNPEGVIARKDRGIETVTDFAGKRVGYNVANPTVYLFEAKLQRAGVDKNDVTWVTVQPEAMVPLLLSGEIDAAMGYWDWEAINAEREGLPVNVFVMSDKQVQVYGPVVSANAEWVQDHGDVIKRFLSASVKGWIDAAADIEASLAVMMKANPEEDEKFMRQALEISMQLIGSSDADEKGFGWMDLSDWQGLQDALLQGEVINEEVDLEALFTNDYLPDNARDWSGN